MMGLLVEALQLEMGIAGSTMRLEMGLAGSTMRLGEHADPRAMIATADRGAVPSFSLQACGRCHLNLCRRLIKHKGKPVVHLIDPPETGPAVAAPPAACGTGT
jgi:hypothetical protein